MKYLFLASGLMLSSGLFAQNVFTYGKYAVGKEEFVRAYKKNPPKHNPSQADVQEYLGLYENFKLKVQAAKDLGLDTSEQLKFDVHNFKNQIADNYIYDEKEVSRLVDQALQRSRKARGVIYFFVPSKLTDKPSDTLQAHNIVQNIVAQLKQGNNNYADISLNASKGYIDRVMDYEVPNVSVFSLPYAYENAVFNTPVGSVSQPYRSANGWHIFKVLDEKENPGKWEVSQILISVPEHATKDEIDAAQASANKIYNELNDNKISFNDAVAQSSTDRRSRSNNGNIEPFTAGTYSAAFEKNVFALKNEGDITAPFYTSFGWHIVRLNNKSTVAFPFSADHQQNIKTQVFADARINGEKEKFAQKAILLTKPQTNKAIAKQELLVAIDSVFAEPNKANSLSLAHKQVLNIGSTKFSGREWLMFALGTKNNAAYRGETNAQLWDKFVEYAATNYYKQNLEKYDPSFKLQLQEFVEGNLLFDIMERKVWGQTNENEEALKELYNKKKDSYKWEQSADVVMFNATSKEAAQKAMEMLKAGSNWNAVVEAGNQTLVADSGRYEVSQLQIEPSELKANSITPLASNGEGNFSFNYILKTYAAGSPKTFEEARGLVANDYQAMLEQKFVEGLRKKYPIKVNQAVLKSVAP